MGKMNPLGHLELIRRINRTLILNTVKSEQPISRAQIAKKLSLSKTTVSAIVDEMIQKKLIVEYGECPSPGGVGRQCWGSIQNLLIALGSILVEQKC